MADERYMMGVFEDEARAAAAVGALENASFSVSKVFSPVPSRRLAEAMRVKKSRAGWFTLAGGIIGFFFGCRLAIFAATRWNLIVTGKPVVALIPFLIVGFEFAILFAVLGNLIGFLFSADLPRFDWRRRHDPRLTGDRCGVLAKCPENREQELADLFAESGAEVKRFPEAPGTP